jgi:hypothetical protein
MDTRLRVGLLSASVFLPLWAFTAIERIIRSNYAELALVILNQSRPKRGSALTAFWQDRNHLLYHLFNAIDKKIFIRGQNALTQVDSSEISSNVPTLEVKPVNENGEQQFCASDIEQIKSYQLDILVKMGAFEIDANRSREEALSQVKALVWEHL